MRRDLISSVNSVEILPPAVYDADNTPVGIDLQGYDSGFVDLHVGIGGITFDETNKIEFILSHSDDNVTYTPVEDEYIQGVTIWEANSGKIHYLNSGAVQSHVVRVGYVGPKRYLKLLADFSGTHATGTPLESTMILGRPVSGPVG